MNLKLYRQPLRCNKQQCVEVKQTLSSLEMFVCFQSLCSTAKKLLHPDGTKAAVVCATGTGFLVKNLQTLDLRPEDLENMAII